ncbi:hypothetical protein GCM10010326_01620 [Streptomyces xanthochromogenes]|uniref:Uncharacterized protein n=1 Tax=Streptomyces xanthochromogenes TaxID=67384 RepID=A0ABQ2ZH07_9ACTN|nr:hypothetical protein GCM10010326_01620 [Streptomyces xanthochromogenes]
MTKVLWAASPQMRPNITDCYDPYPLMTWAAGPKHPQIEGTRAKRTAKPEAPRPPAPTPPTPARSAVRQQRRGSDTGLTQATARHRHTDLARPACSH